MHFLNLHSHRKPQLTDEKVIRNAFVLDRSKLAPLPYFLSCGIHPWLINIHWIDQLLKLENNLQNISQVIAVGECGLDRIKAADWKLQLEVFDAHIQLANKYQKPLILHLVKSYSDILAYSAHIQVPWIIHGFKGNRLEAEQLIKKGARFSFGPRLMLEKNIQETFCNIPTEFIYLETDTKPIDIVAQYTYAAQLRNMPVEMLKEVIWTNFARDFKTS
ncbi:MAG TPA: TatD family hydrolase [Flavobacteriales bacterium]|nr:TatD family hydrolase [Flavobacteriales bacterium]HPH81500.1 TatD family hydrolase [Flavobacteriales bacterium]